MHTKFYHCEIIITRRKNQNIGCGTFKDARHQLVTKLDFFCYNHKIKVKSSVLLPNFVSC